MYFGATMMGEAEQKIADHQEHVQSLQSAARECTCDVCLSLDLASSELKIIPTSLGENCRTLQRLYLDYNDLQLLPTDLLSGLPLLRVLSLIGNDLYMLPDNISDACGLEELYCNENYIAKLPVSFTELSHLKILNIVANQFKSLPNDIEKLQSLEKLYADENNIVSLPEAFGLLASLRILELECNELEELPRSFGRLQQLTILNLSSNKLKDLPENFSELGSLENLDVSSNHLKILPGSMKCWDTLKKLYVESNTVSILPEWIGHLPAIEELSFKNNQLQNEAIPRSFGHTSKKLRSLHMGGNFMTSLPDSIGELESLEKVHFGSVIGELERANFQNGNWLWNIPKTFSHLVNLKSVNLEENQIHELPETFGRLVNLEFLDLGQNQLHELPLSFGDLRSLRVCQLSKNHIELLPSNFGNLSNLEEFRIDHNQLAELPETFAQLSNLKTLDLFNNCLHEFPVCLHDLNNLVRLDLDRNNLDVHYLDVPQMIVQSKYAPRDPNLKDNWRGRARQDLVEIEFTQMEVDENAERAREESPECQDIEYNYTALRNAMRRNMAIWRSHTGSDIRTVDHNYGNKSYGMVKHTGSVDDGNWSDAERTENNPDENADDEKFQHLSSSPDSGSPLPQPLFECTENWDTEVDTMVPVDVVNPYGIKLPEAREELYEPGTAEYCYVGTEHMFLPSTFHAQRIQRFNNSNTSVHSEMGQFENPDGSAAHNCRRSRNQDQVVSSAAILKIDSGQFEDADGEMENTL